jgi:CRP-like cAMP-binding protein
MDYKHFFQLFYPIEQNDWDAFQARCVLKTFEKGDLLLQAGKTQKELYLVEEGVQMSYFDNGDKRQVMAFTYSPSLCAVPESFLMQKPSNYFLEALSYSRLQAISYAHLQGLFETSPIWERVFRKMTEHILAGLIQRHLELQIMTIEERFKQFAHRSSHLFQLVPHKYIANYLGINPTNFSKLYNKIKIDS